MSKSLGHVQRAAVVLAELDSNVLRVGRTFRTQVHYDVEDCATSRLYQFRLCGWRKLKMRAARRSFLAVEGNVGLRDDGFKP